MIHVDSPLVRDPSFTPSSAQHSHKADTDSSKTSTQTPQEALNQQRAVWTRGWNPGSTHVHKTNTGCWSEWKQKHACSEEGPERHVVVITLPANSVMPLLPFFRLCSITSSICCFNSPSQHRPGSFPSNFSSLFLCLLCLHVSPAAARLARELQLIFATRNMTPPNLYSHVLPRLGFDISVQSDAGPQTFNTDWVYLTPSAEAQLSTVKNVL